MPKALFGVVHPAGALFAAGSLTSGFGLLISSTRSIVASLSSVRACASAMPPTVCSSASAPCLSDSTACSRAAPPPLDLSRRWGRFPGVRLRRSPDCLPDPAREPAVLQAAAEGAIVDTERLGSAYESLVGDQPLEPCHELRVAGCAGIV
ncbi:MAG: hypothetical protein OXE02_08325, partial [Chloroflexi bacterium]|nr:hypothetical protein [Chloroflexota bacterium]